MTDIKLTWNNRTTDAVSQKIYRSLEKFDSSNLPTVHAEVAFWIKEYLDEDVTEDAYWYMLSTVTEDDELFSDCVRIEKGVAGECDPHWDKVVSLLHFDGNLVDSTGNNTFYFNGLSSYSGGLFGQGINPGGDYRKRVQSEVHWQLLNGVPLTVELFFKATGTPSSNAIIFISSDAFRRLALYQMTNNTIGLEYGTTEDATVIDTPLSYTEFQHLAFTLDSGILRVFHEGVMVHEGYYPITPVTFSEITIGGMRDNLGSDARPRTAHGVIDELRITKGVARYTENFIPPTEPFPNC